MMGGDKGTPDERAATGSFSYNEQVCRLPWEFREDTRLWPIKGCGTPKSAVKTILMDA